MQKEADIIQFGKKKQIAKEYDHIFTNKKIWTCF